MDAGAVRKFLLGRRSDQGSPPAEELRKLVDLCLNSSSTLPLAQQSVRHWYCNKADATVRNTAEYLIYLFSFNRIGQVSNWVKALEAVVSGCEHCARGFCNARNTFVELYINRFPAATQEAFCKALDDWQASLPILHIQSRPSSSSLASGLLRLPNGLLQLIFGNVSVLQHEKIRDVLQDAIRRQGQVVPDGIVKLGLTPGVLLLASDADTGVRSWGIKALHACSDTSTWDWQGLRLSATLQHLLQSSDYATKEASRASAWTTVAELLDSANLSQQVKAEYLLGLKAESSGGAAAPPAKSLLLDSAGLLRSKDAGFSAVLRVWTLALQHFPSHRLWTIDPSPEFPLVVFGDIKDNSIFQELLVQVFQTSNTPIPGLITLQTDKPGDAAWIYNWLPNYLRSVQDLDQHLSKSSKSDLESVYAEALARVFNFCGEELQHNRFDQSFRANAMKLAMHNLNAAYADLGPTDRSARSAMDATLRTNSSVITGVAFNARDYPQALWSEARYAAFQLVTSIFQSDGEYVRAKITRMGSAAIEGRQRGSDNGEAFTDTKIHDMLWSRTYSTMAATDYNALTILLRGLVRFAHLASPEGNAWSTEGLAFWQEKGQWILKVNNLRKSLDVMKGGFLAKATTFAAINDMSKTKALWDADRIPEILMRMLLSPDAGLHDGTMAIVTETFTDISMRIDCFRAMFEYYPAAALRGLQEYLRKWNEDVAHLPAATESAMWLVRCLTDILECLCRQGGANGSGFLRETTFLDQPSAGEGTIRDDIQRLWQQMAKALGTIFTKTPTWAVFYENEEMVAWMTDALIFGRTMVEELRTFESAATESNANLQSTKSPAVRSKIGSKMTAALEGVFSSVISWLRLTDMETLHQTFELMKLLVARLAKTAARGTMSESLKQSSKTLDGFCRRVKGHRTKLDDGQLSELAELLQPLLGKADDEDASDDGIEFVSTRKMAKTSSAERPIKNAFATMMKSAGGKVDKNSTPLKSAIAPKPRPSMSADVDDGFDDPFSKLSPLELARLERAATHKAAQKKQAAERAAAATSARPALPPVPKPIASTSGIVGKVRQDIRRERNNAAVNAVSGSRFAQQGKQPLVRDLSRRARSPSASSATTSSSSEDDDHAGLSALVDLQQKSPAKLKRLESAAALSRQSVMSKAALNRERQRQNAQRTKNRLKPDMSDFYRALLHWDTSSRTPVLRTDLPTMPLGFRDAHHYRSIMTPLFLEEVWAHSIQAWEDSSNQELVPAQISAKYRTDDFVDIEVNLLGRAPDRWTLNEQDILRLRPQKLPDVGNPVLLFGKVQMVKRISQGMNIGIRLCADNIDLKIQAKWVLQKHMGLSTESREYAALQGMEYYEDQLVADILAARPAKLPDIPEATITRAMTTYNANGPQAKAIVSAFKTQGFVLIQGPPGTGKTKTISGLVGRFMTQRTSVIDQGGKSMPAKLLICAPSNAAIDEVTRRLREGVPNGTSAAAKLRIVRIGAESAVHPSVRDVHLDILVNAALTAGRGTGDAVSEAVLQERIETNQRETLNTQAELEKVGNNDAKRQVLQQKLVQLKGQRTSLFQDRSKARDAARDATRQMDAQRRQARQDILNEADVICSTLSGAGHESISGFDFDTVIIDEAAQAVELSALIPLKYRCTRCIMVGDPKQLPPTVISQAATRNHYDQSLFVRMYKQHPEFRHLLSIQYRMHPDISKLPSASFYDGRLADGPKMAELTMATWHKSPYFGPYRFFNVNGSEEAASRGHSIINPGEVSAIINLYRKLKRDYGVGDSLFGKIGVISMYREQVGLLRNKFRGAFGESCFDDIDFNTVDGFQGQEKSIIIVSCVRSGPHLQSIGFLADERRMNVALTRAKSSLFVFGNARTLERCNDKWRMIVGNARQRGFFVEYNGTTFTAATGSEIALPDPRDVKPPRSAESGAKGKIEKAAASSKAVEPPKEGLIALGQPRPGMNGRDQQLSKAEKRLKADDVDSGSDRHQSKKAKLGVSSTVGAKAGGLVDKKPVVPEFANDVYPASKPARPVTSGNGTKKRHVSVSSSSSSSSSSSDDEPGLDDFFAAPGGAAPKVVPVRPVVKTVSAPRDSGVSSNGQPERPPSSAPRPLKPVNGAGSGAVRIRPPQAPGGSARPLGPPRPPAPAKKMDSSVLFINKKKASGKWSLCGDALLTGALQPKR